MVRTLTMAKLLVSLTFLISLFRLNHSATFTLTNQCTYPVWAGLLSGAGTPPLPTTGFPLQPSQSNTIPVPAGWSGRTWGRTQCSTDPTTGRFSCLTGDCGSGAVECNGAGAAPPATLAEFTLNGANGLDFYDVSLVDGYNLPMMVVPQGGGGGGCNVTGCFVDLNLECPAALRLAAAGGGEAAVACRSACETFGDPRFCCSGEYGTPQKCGPTSYSEYFKKACPTAYSYAYDDGTSTFTCSSANYVITFCPTPANSRKTTGASQSEANSGAISLAKAFSISSIMAAAFILEPAWRL